MLRNRIALGTLMAGVAAVISCSDTSTTPTESAPEVRAKAGGVPANDGAKLLRRIPVSGTLANGGSFAGTLTVTRLGFNSTTGQLLVTGVLNGDATTASGEKVKVKKADFTAPATLTDNDAAGAAVRPVAMQAVCDILFLDIGPISLDLLGLTVDLSQIILDINAVPGAGNLLGNLLCALVGLLDGIALLPVIGQLLESILGILEQINDILSGVGGAGAAGASFTVPGQAGPVLVPSLT
jgi:hypothetical protein